MKNFFLSFVFGVIQIGISQAEYCTNYNYAGTYHSCENGCCDSWPYETCCSNEVWLGWAIAGGVIGGILLISLAVCVVCALVKKKGKTGRVIQPSQGQGQVQPPVYTSTVSHMAAYPQSQGYYPQYTTTVTHNPTAPPAPPPAYQTLYGQQQQQPLPPLPAGLHQQGNNQIV
ncbi:cysteine and tyrosine-rich protein 1-like [Mercenaria mercenaria]|uniref:cysteine and tyrosine-rich protein 1-like n=1 Tax=Mercenaria mercenaria TaxID=6596 RepID=UPI001E1DC898|nr:cysteine and tyrosine-rich protein 1-like [Mercenaria mercenaria]